MGLRETQQVRARLAFVVWLLNIRSFAVQHTSRLAKEAFDLKVKLHFEEMKSVKLRCELDAAEKRIEKMDKELQKCRRLVEDKEVTNYYLHEALERQDLVLKDAQYINQSYQESYQELQARAELHREDTVARPSTLGGAESSAVGGKPPDTLTPNHGPTLPCSRPRRLCRAEPRIPRIQGSNPSGTPLRQQQQQQRPSNRQPLPRSPPTTDGAGDERRDSPEPRSLSSGSCSPVLPEPSDGDLVSTYDPGQARVEGGEGEVDVTLEAPTRPLLQLSIEELKGRTGDAASFFENARNLLDGEGAVSMSRKPVCESKEPSRLRVEGELADPETRSGAVSALSFEVVPSDFADDWVHCVAHATLQSHLASESVDAASHPSSPTPDIWVEEARYSGGGQALPGRRQSSQGRRSAPNSDGPSGSALSSPVAAPRRRACSVRESSFRSKSVDGGQQIREGTPTNTQHHPRTPSANEAADRADATAPQMRNGRANPALRPTAMVQRCPASFTGTAARKLPFPYADNPRKPQAVVLRAGGGGGSLEGRGEMEPEKGRRGEWQHGIEPPSPMFSKSSWESVREPPATEKGFLRSTIAARNRATGRRTPWVPAGGVRAGGG